MADRRSRADKLRDVMNAPSATDGERENARRLLERMGESTTATRDGESRRPSYASHDEPEWDEGDIFTTADIDDFFRRYGRSERQWPGFDARRPFAQGWRTASGHGETPEQVSARIRKMAEELDRQTRTHFSSADKLRHEGGVHVWARVGENVNRTPINRCIVCGEYEKR